MELQLLQVARWRKVVPVYDNSIPTADAVVNKPDGENEVW